MSSTASCCRDEVAPAQAAAVSSSLLSSLLLLFVALLLARLGSRRLRRWAIPGIVLELLLGFGLGNSVLPFAAIAPLAGLTELGVLTLFFLVGLEVRGGLLGSRPLTVLRTVALSALTPLLAWVPLQQAFGLSTPATLLVMAVLSATGTGVTLRLLAERQVLQTPSARLLVGVSVLDDLPAIALLSGAMALGLGVGTGSALTAPPGVPQVLGLLAALLSHGVTGWWRSCHGPWRPDALRVLLLLIGSSWLGELAGLTSLLGALWGGVLLSRLAETPALGAAPGSGSPPDDWRAMLSLLSEVFLPLYFISVGMRIDAATLLHPQAWAMAAVLSLVGVLCKGLCGFGIGAADRQQGVDRWIVVAGLIPRGLPGLVFASTALAQGVIEATQFSALVLMVAVTTVLGLLLLSWRLRYAQRDVQ